MQRKHISVLYNPNHTAFWVGLETSVTRTESDLMGRVLSHENILLHDLMWEKLQRRLNDCSSSGRHLQLFNFRQSTCSLSDTHTNLLGQHYL